MIVFLDTGIIGILSSPRKIGEDYECKQWLYHLLARGIYVASCDLCDYEVRRSLLLNKIKNPLAVEGIENLDQLQDLIEFLPITKNLMKKAAELWAISRSKGQATADIKNIDADIIIATTCQLLQVEDPDQNLIIATTNVKHLSRFLEARNWREIKF
jgi:predicted nucleic acid-binding protein